MDQNLVEISAMILIMLKDFMGISWKYLSPLPHWDNESHFPLQYVILTPAFAV